MNKKYIHIRNLDKFDDIRNIFEQLEIPFNAAGVSTYNGQTTYILQVDGLSQEQLTMIKLIVPCDIKDTFSVAYS